MVDNEKLAEAQLEQRLVVNGPGLRDDPEGVQTTSLTASQTDQENLSQGSSQSTINEMTGDQAAPSNRSDGRREPALIRVKNLKSRKEPKPSMPAAVKKTRNRYMAIALITMFVGILIVPIAWATWTVLKYSFPESAGIEFFMPPKERSQEKSELWRAKMRSMIAQISQMPKPPLTKPATGYGDPRVGQNALAMLTAKKWDELNKTFERAKIERVQHRTGSELMDDLYKALSDPGDVQASVWSERLALLEGWAASTPESATPHIVLADFYVNYAWNARGSGWANQVKDWQWKLFRERLYLSADQLQQALAFGTPSPDWFSVAQINVLGAGNKNDRQIYDSITARSNSLYPNYVPTYLHKVYYLQPRWFGTGREWVDYVKKEADAIGGSEGDKLYARMVANVAHLYNNLYQEVPNLNKERIARGNALLDKQYGGGN
ncbi:hypothetical protein BH10CYA1_BH10CYA1_40980 [soil metagenome]